MKSLEFIDRNVWRRITASVKRHPARCHVAVAYFGEHGVTLLPLEEGSILVVNASETAVKSGQTHPGQLRRLIDRGVAVYSMPNLHAKVVVTPEEVFAGSMNASRRSETYLLESAIRTTNRFVVSAARRFVATLTAIPVGPEEAQRLLTLYRPPHIEYPSTPRKAARRAAIAMDKPLWIARTETVEWDAEDFVAERQGGSLARKQIRDRRRFETDKFVWNGSGLTKLRAGHRLICVHEEPNGRVFVTRAGSVLRVHRYRSGSRRMIFFEVRKSSRRRSLESVLPKLTPKARSFLRNSVGRQVPFAFVDEILRACRDSASNP
jgi:hypothetical protein